MSPVCPMTIAAMNGPTPKTSVTVVPDAITAAPVARSDLVTSSVEDTDLSDQLTGGGDALGDDRIGQLDAVEQGCGSVSGQRSSRAAFDQPHNNACSRHTVRVR